MADPFSSPAPGVGIGPLPAIGLTECFGSTGVPLLMRARTVVDFLAPPFLADLDFDLDAAPPVTLTLPLDPPWLSLLKALAPFSCLKTDSRETNADFPSLKL